MDIKLLNEEDKRLYDDISSYLEKAAKQIYDKNIYSFENQMDIHVAFLNDDRSYHVDNKYTDYFTRGLFMQAAGKSVCFKLLPISDSIASLKKTLVLISDDSELGIEAYQDVKKRADNGLTTFPFNFFSDRFFRPVWGEKIDYVGITDTFKSASESTVISFRESDIKRNREYITSYVFYIACIARLEAMCGAISETIEAQKDIIEQKKSKLINDQKRINSVEGLVMIQNIKAREKFVSYLKDDLESARRNIKRLQQRLNVLSEECDKQIAKVMNLSVSVGISPFTLKLNMKYERLRRCLVDFVNKTRKDLRSYSPYNDKTLKLCDDTNEMLGSRATKLSLIGTFSSGKTTLLNSFLGLGKDRVLKTSAKHNTAVLTKLGYAEKFEDERYEFIYKTNLKWSLIKPVVRDNIYINDEDHSIFINDISAVNDIYTISYTVDEKDKKRKKGCFRFTDTVPAVRKGSTLKPGEPFNKQKIVSTGKMKCILATQDEMDVLIKGIDSGIIKNATIKFFGKAKSIIEIKQVRSFLLSLKVNAPNCTDKEIPYDEVKEYFRDINILDKVVFEAELCKEIEIKPITNDTWKLLFSENGSKPPLCERAECYMLLKELRLYLNSEFLKYSRITDTPGFGSITEEHDATTEKHIHNEPGRLLVMIRLDAKTGDVKFFELINKIRRIYDYYHPEEKEKVVFILNCFTNLASEANLKPKVEEIRSRLIRYGFSAENIYVCDLKKAIMDKEQPERMMGYPSYAAFGRVFTKELISDSIDDQYMKIKMRWEECLEREEDSIKHHIDIHEEQADNLEREKRKAASAINSVSSVSVSDSEKISIIAYAKEIYDDRAKSIKDMLITRTFGNGKRMRNISEQLNEAMTEFKTQNDYIGNKIKEYFDGLMGKVDYYSFLETDVPSAMDPGKVLLVVTHEKLKEQMEESYRSMQYAFSKKRKNSLIDQVTDVIEADKKDAENNINEYWNRCKTAFENYKRDAKAKLEHYSETVKNPADFRKEQHKLEKLKKTYSVLAETFRRIEF